MTLNFILKRLKNLIKIFLERFECIYKEIPNQIVELKSKNQIPHVVYQTWINKCLPWRMCIEIEKFRHLNKDYSFILFDNSDRDKYMRNSWGDRKIYKIYQNSVFESSKSDIWRYCILYEKGGYYFDIKSSCETPLSKLNISKGALISYELNNTYILPSIELLSELKTFDLNLIANWGLGFKKNHPLLRIQIENIEKYSKFFQGKIFKDPKANILTFTGPGMLSKSYRDYLKIYKSKIIPNGVDFFRKGIYQVKGSRYRFKQSSSYGGVKNSKILI